MASKTKIQWATHNWNPIRGCSRVSAGCDNCYAIREAHRHDHEGGPYEGLTVVRNDRIDWNSKVMLVEKDLLKPISWQKPRKIFVASMSDPFHHNVPDEYLDKMFAVMALAPQHIFQLLTKRPERMQEYLTTPDRRERIERAANHMVDYIFVLHTHILRNVWLGTSVEDQATADERIPQLLLTPAAVRWISAEPLLGPIDLAHCAPHTLSINGESDGNVGIINAFSGESYFPATCLVGPPTEGTADGIQWVVVGGESGPGARPFNIQWARDIVAQCKVAGVACFVKQMGAHAYDGERPITAVQELDGWKAVTGNRVRFTGKGGDPLEWPEDLRVREWPEVAK